jgi:hypothetical protein
MRQVNAIRPRWIGAGPRVLLRAFVADVGSELRKSIYLALLMVPSAASNWMRFDGASVQLSLGWSKESGRLYISCALRLVLTTTAPSGNPANPMIIVESEH